MEVHDPQENYTTGYIKLYRSIRNHWIYEATRPRTKYEAWEDILMECNHQEQKVLLDDKLFICKRGDSLNSAGTWAKRWKWNKSKVHRFIKLLQKDKMVELQMNSKTTHLSVINYDIYQDNRNSNETHLKRTCNALETDVTTNNNVKNDKNVKNTLRDFKKQNPEAVKICKSFVETLESDSRFIPKTDTQKLEWLKCAKWSMNRMGEYGEEKVLDIIARYRSGDADNNGFSWIVNWQTLLKLQTKNREQIFYLDYFWENAKEHFKYGV